MRPVREETTVMERGQAMTTATDYRERNRRRGWLAQAVLGVDDDDLWGGKEEGSVVVFGTGERR
jgi:hypothetical protein